jgi:hypothetical protein
MHSIRRSLRLWVTLWLVCQVASLSALVPKDCCAAHRPAASTAKPSCHQEASATRCPMRAATGTTCPMHRGDATGADQASTDACAMQGTCSGPLAAMVAQLSNQGVLPSTTPTLPELVRTAAPVSADTQLITRLVSPDPPPPRT